MFDKDYNFRGSHADKVRFLCEEIEPGKRDFGKFTIFNRYVDVFICGAIVGFIHNRQGTSDSDSKENVATIPMKTMIGEQRNLSFIFKSIILCDGIKDVDSLSNEELKNRMDDAFRFGEGTDRFEANWKRFESFVLGGVDYLYDKFKEVKTREDAVDVINEMIPKEVSLDYTEADY